VNRPSETNRPWATHPVAFGRYYSHPGRGRCKVRSHSGPAAGGKASALAVAVASDEVREHAAVNQAGAPEESRGVPVISVIVEVITPVFGIVLIGWLAARFHAINEAATRGLSLFAFNFAIPAMLLRTLAQTKLPAQPEWRFVLAYFSGAFAVFGLGAVTAATVLQRRGAEPSIFGISAAFSNTTILGIPIVLRAYGDAAAVPLSLILGFHSALLFTLTTVVAEIGAGVGTPLLTVVRKVIAGLLGNPILWGIAGGLMLNLLGLSLPAVLDQLAATLGMAALPTALFALGANLSRFHLSRTLRAALLLTLLKVVLQPALIYVLGAYVFDLSPLALAIAVTLGALPTGINAYLFAARYDAAVGEATSTILVSTLASTVTVALLLAYFKG
jgi:malonate transporter and related proteins